MTNDMANDGRADGDMPTVASLRCVVERYGRLALTDAVALRAALRTCGGDLPASEVDLLVVVAGSGVDLRSAAWPESGTADSAVGATVARTGLPPSEVRRACEALAAALGPPAGQAGGGPGHTTDLPVAPPHADSAPRRISWDDSTAPDRTTRAIPVPAPQAVPLPSRGRRHRRVLIILAGAFLLVAATVVGVALLAGRAGEPLAPDRFAVDQVAQRYRALGADLLGGASRCAPVAPEPGERERVDCSFGSWSMVLVSYDTPGRLADAREQATRPDPASGRAVDRTEDGAAFAMHQTRSGTSSLYWDAGTPRPMSAAVSTDDLSPAELAAFWDSRGSTLLRRPELEGLAFESAALWEMAGTFVRATDAECAPTPVDDAYADAEESITCRYPNGVVAEFVLLSDSEQFTRYRTRFASEANVVSQTRRLGAWLVDDETENRGQIAEYVASSDGNSYVYFDQRDVLSFGLMYHPDLSQDDLKAFWSTTATP